MVSFRNRADTNRVVAPLLFGSFERGEPLLPLADPAFGARGEDAAARGRLATLAGPSMTWLV